MFVQLGDVLMSHWTCRDYSDETGKSTMLFKPDEIFVVISVSHPTECEKDFYMLSAKGLVHWQTRFRSWTDVLTKMNEVDDGCK